jgi:hypothetical protein
MSPASIIAFLTIIAPIAGVAVISFVMPHLAFGLW